MNMKSQILEYTSGVCHVWTECKESFWTCRLRLWCLYHEIETLILFYVLCSI